eukprot:12451139-Ditylum_brightwellii.AAC.1
MNNLTSKVKGVFLSKTTSKQHSSGQIEMFIILVVYKSEGKRSRRQLQKQNLVHAPEQYLFQEL